ncbi:MAG: DUF6161 domain-containing protein [Deltaproteobacteria bacterium]
MDPKKDDAFRVDVTHSLTGDRLHFESRDAVVAWAEGEAAGLQELSQMKFANTLQGLASREIVAKLSAVQVEAQIRSLGAQGFIPSTTPLGVWLKSLHSRDREIARAGIDRNCANQNASTSQQVALVAKAVVLAHRGLGVNWQLAGEAEREAWLRERSKIRREADEALAALQAEQKASAEASMSASQSFEEWVEEEKKATLTRWERLDGVIADGAAKITEGQEEYARLLAQFREHMALEAPVQYWKEQATKHEGRARGQWRQVLAYGVVLVTLLLGLLAGLRWLTQDDAKTPTWIFAGLAIFAAVGLGLIRMAAKSWATHQHLASVYEEKAVMTQVYLALMSNEALDKAADRPLLLGAIFQPSSTGLVKDDHLPPTIVEAASRLVGGKG